MSAAAARVDGLAVHAKARSAPHARPDVGSLIEHLNIWAGKRTMWVADFGKRSHKRKYVDMEFLSPCVRFSQSLKMRRSDRSH